MPTLEERNVLRELAKQVADVADLPIQSERRELWKRHHALRPFRPLILIFPEGSWRELLPDDHLRCTDPYLRHIERELRIKVYTHERFDTDFVIEKHLNVSRMVGHTGWGLEARRTPSPQDTGAWAFNPVIRTYDDAKKLTAPRATVDEAEADRRLALAQDLLGDILPVRSKGITHNACHIAALLSGWRGLEQLYLDMIESPAWVHETVRFITDGLIDLWKEYEQLGALSLNNEDDYHSSGGVGYTDNLPQDDYDPGSVRFCDVWGSAESQEMTAVSPDMHAEFFMHYEAEFMKPFAMNGYGCCDDLTRKLDTVCTLPQMRRISIAPFADVERCAERLKGEYILSWKPQPQDLVGFFEPDTIRRRIRNALEAAGRHNCVFEMILKDTHTCEGRPERFTKWSRIAREEVDRFVGGRS